MFIMKEIWNVFFEKHSDIWIIIDSKMISGYATCIWINVKY